MKAFLKSGKVRLLVVGVLVAALVMSFSPINFYINPIMPQSQSKSLSVGNQHLVLTIGNVAHATGTLDYAWNGVNDNVNVATAIAVLNSHGGGELVMMTENYTFLASVNVPANITIRGLGASTKISFNGVNPVFIATGASVVFRDFSTDAGSVTALSTTLVENINGNTPTGRGATLVVASVNATAIEKAQADYICDGVADDVQIQAAINSLPNTGGTVLLSEGNFISTSLILITSNVTLRGQGFSTTLISNTGLVSGVKLNGDYAQIRDMVVQGAGTAPNFEGIDAGSNSKGVRVQGVKVTSWYRGIYWGFHADQSFILNNYIDSVAIGMDLWRSDSVKVIGNSVTNTSKNGIILDSNTYSLVQGNTVYNWDTSAGGFSAILVSNQFNASVGNSINGNTIWGNSNASALSSAIVVSGEANNTNLITNFSVIGNTVNGTRGHGISGVYLHSFDGTHDNVRNGTIAGNTVSGYDDGFRSAWGQGITWQGNTSSFNNNDGWLISVGTNQILNGNIARNNSQSAANTYDGFRIQSTSTNITLTGNLAYDDQTSPTQRYGIAEFTADCVGTRYDNNTLGVGATGQFNSVGSSFKVYNNTGYVTENSGNFTISSNLWGVSVNHGLSTNATSVQLTLTSNATAIPYILSPITTTAFSVNLTALQGSSITGYWRAVYGAGN